MVDGEDVAVTADEVILTERPREGWSVINEQGDTVALDLEITPELRRAGLARTAIRGHALSPHQPHPLGQAPG